MGLRSTITAVAGVFVLARSAHGQTPSAANPVGVWRGTSSCTVRPSPCKDEIAVYRITRTTHDSVSLDARKLVGGREEAMGVLACLAAPRGQITCTMPNGVWHFTIRRDSLVGELRLMNDTKYRDVRAARSP
ncbi:MAG: hypothetical protein DMD35_03190 [Gemmatimonadetes bacterium]|nr:MAG: hypothetical protein DMD35_03190 [Gemmatimonadota bacterium]